MISSILRGGLDLPSLLFMILAYAFMLFVMLPVHEFAHAFAAHRLGDDTAKYSGRLTLNPFAHLDLLGAAMLVLVGFGYAKPVPVNPYNFKKPKVGMALTALAGPVSNLLMATVSVGLYRVLSGMFGSVILENNTIYYTNNVSLYLYIIFISVFASVNIGLAVFNLLPIPPLDGSRIFSAILPDKFVWWTEKYSRYIQIGLFVLILTGVLDTPLYYLRHFFGWLICSLFGLPNLF